MTADITGASTRKVDDLVKALGCDSGVSKSTVSRSCAGIDADVHVLRTRRLDHQAFVYVWLDATSVYVREHRHVTSKAVVIATGLHADGHREVPRRRRRRLRERDVLARAATRAWRGNA